MRRLQQYMQREQEFLADAAHELKTPLAIIQVNATTLAESTDAERRQAAKAGIERGIERAARSVQQLLSLTRSSFEPAADSRVSLDVPDLLRDRMAEASPVAARRSIELELDSPPHLSLPLFRESFEALIDNLLDNAIKYSPVGGVVRVGLAKQDHVVQLTVADQGPGISASFRERVFERFFRVPGVEQPGSGLGLAIVQKAAAQNGIAMHLEHGSDERGLCARLVFSVSDSQL